MSDLYIDGVVRRYIRDLRIGDRVDLQNDLIADPGAEDIDIGSEHPEFAFEFQTITDIEIESPDCTRVNFENFSCGFPPDHLVDVDGEQIRDKPIFVECGCCGHFHAKELPGSVDCRDDAHRFTWDQLDARYGADEWEEISLEEQLRENDEGIDYGEPIEGNPNVRTYKSDF